MYDTNIHCRVITLLGVCMYQVSWKSEGLSFFVLIWPGFTLIQRETVNHQTGIEITICAFMQQRFKTVLNFFNYLEYSLIIDLVLPYMLYHLLIWLCLLCFSCVLFSYKGQALVMLELAFVLFWLKLFTMSS